MSEREPDGGSPDDLEELRADRTSDSAVTEMAFGQRSKLCDLDDGHVEHHRRGLAQQFDAVFEPVEVTSLRY